MNSKQKGLILGGLALLVWWWWKQKAQGAPGDTATPADPFGQVQGLLGTLGAGKGADTGPSFADFLGATQVVANENKKTPPPDTWIWAGLAGSDKDKPVPIEEYLRFDKNKCPGGDCTKYGFACIRGWNCLPGDPGYQK